MKTITATEFYRHIGKYLSLCLKGEKMVVTKYGKIVCHLCPPKK